MHIEFFVYPNLKCGWVVTWVLAVGKEAGCANFSACMTHGGFWQQKELF